MSGLDAESDLEGDPAMTIDDAASLKAELTDWILVADGVKHDWRCQHDTSRPHDALDPICLRCQVEALTRERKDLIDQTYRLGDELAVEKLRRIKAVAQMAKERDILHAELVEWRGRHDRHKACLGSAPPPTETPR